MELKELYLKRQSTRKYSGQPVTDGELEKICRLGALAPSAKKFAAVENVCNKRRKG